MKSELNYIHLMKAYRKSTAEYFMTPTIYVHLLFDIFK